MGAFVVTYERNNASGDEALFRRAMARLSYRGPDGSNSLALGHVQMGAWFFYTTPEEIGEIQPLALAGLPFKIVWDGRLDNRDEVLKALGFLSNEAVQYSDAALVLCAYERWGVNCFCKLVGEFALVIYDEYRNELICARDPLGERSLAYALMGERVVIASEPWAVLGAFAKEPMINAKAAFHYFALTVSDDGQTLFEDVFSLLPGHYMVVTSTICRLERYWAPDPLKKIRYKTDIEYAEHFRSLLEDAIRSQLRSALPTGVLMSGGLDSTSIASLAARMIAPRQLTTISYTFNKFLDCDESEYIHAVTQKWNLRSLQIVCDDALPYSSWERWPFNPNHPSANFYWWLMDRAYKCAHKQGVKVLLAGHFGDHLYLSGRDWVADLVLDGKFTDAVDGLVFLVRKFGWRKVLQAGHHRRILRRFFDSIWPGAVRLPVQHPTPPAWLHASTPALGDSTNWLNRSFERFGGLLDLSSMNADAYKSSDLSRFGLDLRNPFRYRPLIEFILAVPAYQLHSQGMHKYILRLAMRGILPENVRLRTTKTSFMSLYFSGLEQHKERMSLLLNEPDASWRKYVKAEWVLQNWSDVSLKISGQAILVPFLCLAFNKWISSLDLSISEVL